MKKYQVTIPVTGVISVEVEACNEQAAIRKVFEGDDLTVNDIEDWDIHEKIVEGNVFHGLLNEIEVEEI